MKGMKQNFPYLIRKEGEILDMGRWGKGHNTLGAEIGKQFTSVAQPESM